MRKIILVSALIGGVLAAFGGVLAALGLAALAWFGRGAEGSDLATTGALALAAGAIGVGLGFPLAWAGWRGLCGAPGRPFALPRWGWWLLALVLVLIIGQIAISAGIGWLIAPLHLAAIAVPVFLLLALATGSARRGGGQVNTRPAVGSLAWGGLGGIGIGIFVELILGLVALVVVAVCLAVARPDLLEQMRAWALEIQQTGAVPDLRALGPLARSPWVWLGALGFGCVVAPLIEEGAKGLAVPLVRLTGRRLTRLDGFLFGVAAGAGFALFEGAVNGTMALQAAAGWPALVLLRGGATAMHCLASGLVGLGWQMGLTERRWGRAAGLALLGLALHGAWNFGALGTSLVSLGVGTAGGAGAILGGLINMALMGLLGLLYVSAVIALAVIPRRLAVVAEAEAEVEAEAEASEPDDVTEADAEALTGFPTEI